MKKHAKKAGTGTSAGLHHQGSGPAETDPEAFSAEDADAFQVVDQIVALREALASAEKRPFSLATRGPAAVRRLLDILENLNLRLAELESRD
jgi:hypothetical protein